MDCLCDVSLLVYCLCIAFIDGVVGAYDDEHLLGLLDPSELAVEPSEGVAEVVDLLDGELPFELIKKMPSGTLVEPGEVVVIRTLIESDPTLHESFYEVGLPTVLRTVQP